MKKSNVQSFKATLLVLVLFLSVVTLSACQAKPEIKPFMKSSEVRNNFDSVNTALLTTQGTVMSSTKTNKPKTKNKKKKESVKTTKYISYDRTAKSTLIAQKKAVSKVIASFEKTNLKFGLPKDTLNYSKKVLAYINKAETAKKPSDLEDDYHRLADQGARTYFKVLKPTKKHTQSERIMAAIMAFDVKQKRVSNKGKKNETNSNSPALTDKEKNNSQANDAHIFYPKSSLGISIPLGSVLVVLSALLILFVFLQPSKANDAMNALTDTSGNDLLSEAKPDDYTLFLMRGTKILALAIVIILGYLEFKG